MERVPEARATEIGNDVARAAALLVAGEVVGVPTETVYGLAANALADAAVLKVYAAKDRPQFNPLILHLRDAARAAAYVTAMPDAAMRLAETFWPGPLTLLLPKSALVPDLVTAGSPLVALRVPSHPVMQALLNQVDFPLAAPSANPSGYVSPTTAQHVLENLGGRISYVLDGGPSALGIESTIVGFDGVGKAVLHREGAVPVEALEAALGASLRRAAPGDRATVTPGSQKSHYATRTPLYLGDIDRLLKNFREESCAVISFDTPYPDAAASFVLSPRGSVEDAARQLFQILREADNADCSVILAGPVPEEGVGRAVNDRLRRAQHLLKGM